MSAKSNQLLEISLLDKRHNDLESSSDNFQAREETLSPLLPRSAWNSQLAYLRVILKAKLALDAITNPQESITTSEFT